MKTNSMKKAEINLAAKKANLVISTSDTMRKDEPLESGWMIRAERSYFSRPYRVAWVTIYSLVAPDGSTPIAGYTTRESFSSYVARRFEELQQKFSTN